MAKDKADQENFKSSTAKALQKSLAEAMNTPAWKNADHKDHLDAVAKVHNLYRQAHRAK